MVLSAGPEEPPQDSQDRETGSPARRRANVASLLARSPRRRSGRREPPAVEPLRSCRSLTVRTAFQQISWCASCRSPYQNTVRRHAQR